MPDNKEERVVVNGVVSVPTPDDLRPPFDFQLMGHLDPNDWYWQAEDGRAYASKRGEIITSDDPTYAQWVKDGYVPRMWPRDADDKQTDGALRELLASYGKKLPE